LEEEKSKSNKILFIFEITEEMAIRQQITALYYSKYFLSG